MTRSSNRFIHSSLRGAWLGALGILVAHASSARAAGPPVAPKPAATTVPAAAPPPAPKPAASSVPVAAPPVPDAMKSTAGDLFEKGVQALGQGKWEECRAALLAAWSIHRNYQIAGNLAECDVKLARFADAADHLTFFLKEMPVTAPAERRARGEELLREVRPKVAELTIRVNKPDAEIFIDGRSVGRSPLATAIFVEIGERNVEAKLGGKVARAGVSAKGGGAHEVALAFDDVISPPPSETSPLRREVWVTGVVAAGAGAVAGVALLGAGAAKKGATDELRDQLVGGGNGQACAVPSAEPRCKQFTDAAGASQLMTNTGAAVLIGAGALALGTVAYVVVAGHATKNAPLQAGFVWTPTGGGAVVRASW